MITEWLAPGSVVGLLGGIAGVVGAVTVMKKAVSDRRHGDKGVEQKDRIDTIADRDGLITIYREEMATLRTEVDALQRRITHVEDELTIERAWTQMLRDHIYRQKPPPPPARPTSAPKYS